MINVSFAILLCSLVLLIVSAWQFHQKGKRRNALFIEDRASSIQPIPNTAIAMSLTGMEMESLPPSTDSAPPQTDDADTHEYALGLPELHEGLADEVEVFVAHGKHALAIQLLEEHIRHNPYDSPAPYLLLLDLLHRAGDSCKYERVRKLCRGNFNIIVPTFDTYDTSLPATEIESYRHVVAELQKLWQTAKANAYLAALLYDNRGGYRIGFDQSAYQDILLLRDIREIMEQEEALPVPEMGKYAARTQPVRRPDDVRVARELDLAYQG